MTLNLFDVDASLDAKAAEVASMLSRVAGEKEMDYDQASETSSIMANSGIKRYDTKTSFEKWLNLQRALFLVRFKKL